MERDFTAEEQALIAELRELLSSGVAKEIRESARVRRFEVATAVPCDPSAVMRWEANLRVPRPAVALRLAEIYCDIAAKTTTIIAPTVGVE